MEWKKSAPKAVTVAMSMVLVSLPRRIPSFFSHLEQNIGCLVALASMQQQLQFARTAVATFILALATLKRSSAYISPHVCVLVCKKPMESLACSRTIIIFFWNIYLRFIIHVYQWNDDCLPLELFRYGVRVGNRLVKRCAGNVWQHVLSKSLLLLLSLLGVLVA